MDDNRPLHEQAFEDYKKGLKQKEIAEKYGVTISAVKSWKSRHWSNEKLQPKSKKVATKNVKGCNQKSEKVATNSKKVCTPKKKPGGQPGNKNAEGAGAPQGNQNNFKHGIYEKLIFETLTEDEKALAREIDIDEEIEIRRELRLCDIHIARNMKRIQGVQSKPGGLLVQGVSKTITSVENKAFSNSTHTSTVSSTDLILRYENEIQKFRKQKIKLLEMLLRMGYDSCKLEIELMKAEAMVQANEAEEPPSSNLVEALNTAAKEVWLDE